MQRVPEDGILKRSSAFLANLAHPSSRQQFNFEHSSPDLDDDAPKFLRPSKNCYRVARASSSRYTTGLKGYFSILSSGDNSNAELRALQRSPSVQTLSTSWKKKGAVGVKKSVSFSSDTSFEEKRAPYRKQSAVHEAKIYRKGVLQGESWFFYFSAMDFSSHLVKLTLAVAS